MAEELYVKYQTNESGERVPVGYAYGEPWVSMALYMDDIGYPSEGAARAAWTRWKAKDFYREEEEEDDY